MECNTNRVSALFRQSLSEANILFYFFYFDFEFVLTFFIFYLICHLNVCVKSFLEQAIDRILFLARRTELWNHLDTNACLPCLYSVGVQLWINSTTNLFYRFVIVILMLSLFAFWNKVIENEERMVDYQHAIQIRYLIFSNYIYTFWIPWTLVTWLHQTAAHMSTLFWNRSLAPP